MYPPKKLVKGKTIYINKFIYITFHASCFIHLLRSVQQQDQNNKKAEVKSHNTTTTSLLFASSLTNDVVDSSTAISFTKDEANNNKSDSQEEDSSTIIDPEKQALNRLLNILERHADGEENGSRKSKRSRTIKKI